LLKQVRTRLVETTRPVLEAMVLEVTGVKIVTMHHDISTATAEEVVLFTLARSPDFREAKSFWMGRNLALGSEHDHGINRSGRPRIPCSHFHPGQLAGLRQKCSLFRAK
jgi:hypothetical protein